MFSSVQFSPSVVSDSLQPRESQHARPPCPSQTPRVYPNSSIESRWCHPAILSSVIPFSSCPQYLPASGSFPMSQLFTWGGQSIGASALASVLPMNTQDWSPLGWTGWISLQSKGLSRVFSNTIVQKHQFFGAQLSSQSSSHIHTWPLDMVKTQAVDLKAWDGIWALVFVSDMWTSKKRKLCASVSSCWKALVKLVSLFLRWAAKKEYFCSNDKPSYYKFQAVWDRRS